MHIGSQSCEDIYTMALSMGPEVGAIKMDRPQEFIEEVNIDLMVAILFFFDR